MERDEIASVQPLEGIATEGASLVALAGLWAEAGEEAPRIHVINGDHSTITIEIKQTQRECRPHQIRTD